MIGSKIQKENCESNLIKCLMFIEQNLEVGFINGYI